MNGDFRLWIGKTLESSFHFLLRKNLFPFARRLPVGLAFCHDLNRFLGNFPRLVLDVGANIGQSTEHFRSFWPESAIHAFEPIQESVKVIRHRFQQDQKVFIHPYALGEQPKEVSILLHSDSQQNSLLSEAKPGQSNFTVEVRTLDEVAAVQGLGVVDLLKMDVEGFELQVLKGAAALLRERRIRSILAECRFLRISNPQTQFEDLDRFLTSQGFLFSGFYETYRWGPAKEFAAFSNGLWLLPDPSALKSC